MTQTLSEKEFEALAAEVTRAFLSREPYWLTLRRHCLPTPSSVISLFPSSSSQLKGVRSGVAIRLWGCLHDSDLWSLATKSRATR